MNGTVLEMKYNIDIVVGEVNEMKKEFDSTWNMANIRNTIVKHLDANNFVMSEPLLQNLICCQLICLN